MIRLTPLHRLLIGTACVLALSACVTTGPKQPEKMPLEQEMAKATQASNAGKKEEALKLLDQAAKDYPADKAPYVSQAQIKFEGGQYGEAILDAQKALARDPTDKVANSIVAIAGLRLSTTAVGDLIRQNNLTGSLRNESQELAKLLRESLGEDKLVTPTPKARAVAVTPPPVRPLPARKSVTAAKDATDGDNPFGALK